MRTAIYARKSTDQQVSDEAKSVARQIQHARAFAAEKGWTVDEAAIYVDDGVSGAEFANRPGYVRLMGALKPRPPFDVLVMSENSRLGREAWETGYALKQILQAGVRVFFYLEGRECTFAHPMDKLLFSMVQAIDEMERARASQRSTDKARQLAADGYVTGNRLFGYDNVRVDSHTERRINEAEAVVVRRIFALCAEGRGYCAIAKQLNVERAPSPRAQQDRPTAWAPSSVREALFRDTYRGEIVWNRSKKRNTWGQVKQIDRQPDDWVRIPAPHLQIVDDALWQSAHGRLSRSRASYLDTTGGARHGRPSREVESKYLLTGFARCGHCGGTMYVKQRKQGTVRQHVYGCTSYHRRGAAVCKNSLEVPLEMADHAVIDALLRDIVNPDVLGRVVDRAVSKAEGKRGLDPTAGIKERVTELDREIGRIVTAITVAGDVAALASALRDRQQERTGLLSELASATSTETDYDALRAGLLEHVEEWRGMLSRAAVSGRGVLRKLLASSPIVFTPYKADKKMGYAFDIAVPLANFCNGRAVPGGDATLVATLKTTGFIDLPRRRAA